MKIRLGVINVVKYSKEVLDKELNNAISEIYETKSFENWLKMCSKMHKYSFTNKLLIWAKKPDATHVMSFTKWRELGRYPKKNTGIPIIAPIIRKDEDGEDKVVSFRYVYVFDISDTSGDEIFDESISLNDGYSIQNFEDVFTKICEVAPCSISVVNIEDDNVLGAYSVTNDEIKLSASLSDLDKITTLLHEIGHALIHKGKCNKSTDIKEVEAESFSYIVSSALGIPKELLNSPTYIARHAYKLEPNDRKELLENIDILASSFIEKVLVRKEQAVC